MSDFQENKISIYYTYLECAIAIAPTAGTNAGAIAAKRCGT